MLDSRESLAYIRILRDGWPRLPTDRGTVQEARQTRRLPSTEPLATGHVCLRLLTFRSGRIDPSTDDGRTRRGTTSTHHRRCVRPGKRDRRLFPTCPLRGGLDHREPRNGRAGEDPDGNHLVRPRCRQGTSSLLMGWARADRARCRRSCAAPWHASRGPGEVGGNPVAVQTRDSWIHGGPFSRRGRGPQVSTACRRRPGGFAQPAAAVQEGDKR